MLISPASLSILFFFFLMWKCESVSVWEFDWADWLTFFFFLNNLAVQWVCDMPALITIYIYIYIYIFGSCCTTTTMFVLCVVCLWVVCCVFVCYKCFYFWWVSGCVCVLGWACWWMCLCVLCSHITQVSILEISILELKLGKKQLKFFFKII